MKHTQATDRDSTAVLRLRNELAITEAKDSPLARDIALVCDQLSDLLDHLESTVAKLADEMEWNWTRQGLSERCAADMVLRLMAREGLIEHENHPLGGNIWKVNGKLYGRL